MTWLTWQKQSFLHSLFYGRHTVRCYCDKNVFFWLWDALTLITDHQLFLSLLHQPLTSTSCPYSVTTRVCTDSALTELSGSGLCLYFSVSSGLLWFYTWRLLSADNERVSSGLNVTYLTCFMFSCSFYVWRSISCRLSETRNFRFSPELQRKLQIHNWIGEMVKTW